MRGCRLKNLVERIYLYILSCKTWYLFLSQSFSLQKSTNSVLRWSKYQIKELSQVKTDMVIYKSRRCYCQNLYLFSLQNSKLQSGFNNIHYYYLLMVHLKRSTKCTSSPIIAHPLTIALMVCAFKASQLLAYCNWIDLHALLTYCGPCCTSILTKV